MFDLCNQSCRWNSKRTNANPCVGIRKFAGPTNFDWLAVTSKDPRIIFSCQFLGPRIGIPKSKYSPGLVSLKSSKLWLKDRTPVLSSLRVNVVVLCGVDDVQILLLPLPMYELW